LLNIEALQVYNRDARPHVVRSGQVTSSLKDSGYVARARRETIHPHPADDLRHKGGNDDGYDEKNNSHLDYGKASLLVSNPRSFPFLLKHNVTKYGRALLTLAVKGGLNRCVKVQNRGLFPDAYKGAKERAEKNRLIVRQ
jgi:hypothetical protein